MTLKEIKEMLNDGISPKLPLLLRYSDTDFIANQYIRKIADIKGKYVEYVDSLSEVPYSKAFYVEPDYICVIVADTFDITDYMDVYTSLVIVSKEFTGNTSSVVDIPKLEPWMIKDYLKQSLSGLDDKYIDFIMKTSSNDVYRIQSIIDKFSVFDRAEQQSMFVKACSEGEFSDVLTYSAFDLSNAITSRNNKLVADILSDSYVQITTDFGLVALLYKEFKTIFSVQTSNKSAAELNLSDKRYFAIKKYVCGKYTKDELIRILMFLSMFDYRIKSGEIINIDTLNYIILTVLCGGGNYENICSR